MTQQDTKTPTTLSTAIVLLLTGIGALFIVIGVLALVATSPVNWFGVSISLFVGIYSFMMAQFMKRRQRRG